MATHTNSRWSCTREHGCREDHTRWPLIPTAVLALQGNMASGTMSPILGIPIDAQRLLNHRPAIVGYK